MSIDTNRDALREKIEAGERRNAERSLADYARDAGETATDFVKKHPVATVAGGLALGLIIGAMTKPGRRLAGKGGALAALAAEAAVAYGMNALNSAGNLAGNGADKLGDIGGMLGDKARNFGGEAAALAGSASDRTAQIARRAGSSVRGLKDRITH